jgi:hypothetical protein
VSEPVCIVARGLTSKFTMVAREDCVLATAIESGPLEPSSVKKQHLWFLRLSGARPLFYSIGYSQFSREMSERAK